MRVRRIEIAAVERSALAREAKRHFGVAVHSESGARCD
jgi:hypothetical protein